MAFVPITGASMQCQIGKTGTSKRFTCAALGFITFADGQTFFKPDGDLIIKDFFVADNVNAGDYLELYVNGRNTGIRYYGGLIEVASTFPRFNTGPIKSGSVVALYFYSA